MREKYARRVAAVVACGAALAIAPPGRGAAQERTEVVEPWFFTIDGSASGPINDQGSDSGVPYPIDRSRDRSERARSGRRSPRRRDAKWSVAPLVACGDPQIS